MFLLEAHGEGGTWIFDKQYTHTLCKIIEGKQANST